jgi:hypothetical protein
MPSLWYGIDGVVDLLGCLPVQEQATGDHDQIPPGKAVAEGAEDRLCQPHDPRDRRQQQHSHDQRGSDPEPTSLLPVLGGQFVRQDRDEDQVVDAEHDLHGDEGHHRCPSLGSGKEGETKEHDGMEVTRAWGFRYVTCLVERSAGGPRRQSHSTRARSRLMAWSGQRVAQNVPEPQTGHDTWHE